MLALDDKIDGLFRQFYARFRQADGFAAAPTFAEGRVSDRRERNAVWPLGHQLLACAHDQQPQRGEEVRADLVDVDDG